MHETVEPGRHHLFVYDSLNPLQLACAGDRQVDRPLREVDFLPTSFHIVRDQPRQRRHTAVPRPPRFVGMAIITRPPEQGCHVGRSWHIAPYWGIAPWQTC